VLGVSDTELAARLECGRVSEFRRLIRKHEKVLQQIGSLPYRQKNPPGSNGRPEREFWLTDMRRLHPPWMHVSFATSATSQPLPITSRSVPQSACGRT
jgi:hypothetical protein